MPDSDSVPGGHRDAAPRPARSAARRTAAGPPRAGRRAARTCWRWPSRPSACRARRRRSRRARRTARRPGPAPTDVRRRAGSRPARRGTAPARRPARAGRPRRSAAAGTMSSFCTNFTPSATSCAQPWNAAGVHRAEPALHVRHHLVLGLARRAAAAPGTRRARRPPGTSRPRRASLIARTPRRGRARPAGSIWRRRPVGLRVARTPPAPWRPATAWRPGPPARSPCAAGALEAVGQQQRPQPEAGAVVEAVEVDAEHLVRLALVPGRAGADVGDAGERRRPRGTRVRSSSAATPSASTPSAQVAHDVETGRLLVVARRPRTASRRSRSPSRRGRCVQRVGHASRPGRRPSTALERRVGRRRRRAAAASRSASGCRRRLRRPAADRRPATSGRCRCAGGLGADVAVVPTASRRRSSPAASGCPAAAPPAAAGSRARRRRPG